MSGTKMRTLMRTFLWLVGVAVCAAIVMALTGCGRPSTRATKDESASWTASLSDDQKRVAEEFGPPSMFGVTFGQDVIGEIKDPGGKAYRLEWWDYPELRRRFVFADGSFLTSDEITDPADESPGDIYYVNVTPGDFEVGMSEAAVQKLLGSKPTSEVEFKPQLMADLTADDWNGVVTAVFDKDGLVGVQTRAAIEGGAR